MRKLPGIGLLIAAVVVFAEAYGNSPDQSTCDFINNMNRQLGEAATCSTGPNAAMLGWAAALAVAGIAALYLMRKRGAE